MNFHKRLNFIFLVVTIGFVLILSILSAFSPSGIFGRKSANLSDKIIYKPLSTDIVSVHYSNPCGTGCHVIISYELNSHYFTYKKMEAYSKPIDLKCEMPQEYWKSVVSFGKELDSKSITPFYGDKRKVTCPSDLYSCFDITFDNQETYTISYNDRLHMTYLSCNFDINCPLTNTSFFNLENGEIKDQIVYQIADYGLFPKLREITSVKYPTVCEDFFRGFTPSK